MSLITERVELARRGANDNDWKSTPPYDEALHGELRARLAELLLA